MKYPSTKGMNWNLDARSFNMSYEDAERLLSELYTYMPNEYPIYAGEKERAKWLRKTSNKPNE